MKKTNLKSVLMAPGKPVKGSVTEDLDLANFISKLPRIPSIQHPRIRTGAMLIALGYKNKRPKARYIVEPEQLSFERHHRNLEILAIKHGGLNSKILAEYKRAAQEDYNKSISKG